MKPVSIKRSASGKRKEASFEIKRPSTIELGEEFLLIVPVSVKNFIYTAASYFSLCMLLNFLAVRIGHRIYVQGDANQTAI
jgi:hypothetical protein